MEFDIYVRKFVSISVDEGTATPSKRSGSSDIAFSARTLMSSVAVSKLAHSCINLQGLIWTESLAEHWGEEH